MTTIRPSTTGAYVADARPYDAALSRKIDAVLIELDDQPTPLRHAVLRIRKIWYERNVPAYYGEVAR